MKFKAVLRCLIAFVLAGAGALAAPAVVTHLADESRTLVNLRITEEIRIVLPFPADGGRDLEWQVISNDTRYLRMVSPPKPAGAETKAAAEEKKPGEGNSWETSLLALRPGRSVVRLVCVRPSGVGEFTSVDSREVAVTVYQ